MEDGRDDQHDKDGNPGDVDFTPNENHSFILSATTTGDQAHNVLLHDSEIYRNLVPESLLIEDILRQTIRSLAGSNRSTVNTNRWGNPQHDQLFKLAGVRRIKSLTDQPFVFKICFSLLVQFAPFNTKSHLVKFISWLKEDNIDLNLIEVDEYRAIMKEQTLKVKHANSRLDSKADWYWYADWDQFCGYNMAVPLTMDEVQIKVDEWCRGEIERPLVITEYGNLDYYRLYHSKCEDILYFLESATGDCMDFQRWVLRTPLWVTTGSSRGLKVSVFDNVTKQSVASKNSKSVLPQFFDSLDIANYMVGKSTPDDDTYSVAEKIEPGQKKRLIISAPWIQQLRMAYVDTYISKLLPRLNRYTTLFMNSERIFQFYNEIIVSCKDPTNIHLPLDVDGFDHSVTEKEVKIIFDVMIGMISRSKLSNSWRLQLMLDIAKDSWFGKEVMFNKNEIATWDHGMPSGVKWTSFFDTLIGIIRFEVCCAMLSRTKLGKPNVFKSCFQGDDMLLILKRRVDIVRIIKWYNDIGVKVSPVKNFISKTHDEFLRKIYFKDGMSGYISRRLVKLAIRDPLKPGAGNKIDNLKSNISSLWSLLWRGARYEAVYEIIMYVCRNTFADLKWVGEKPNDTEIRQWLSTFTCLGGLGLDLLGPVNFTKAVAIEIIYTDILPSKRYSVSAAGVYRQRQQLIERYMEESLSFEKDNESIAQALAPDVVRVKYMVKKVYPIVAIKKVRSNNLSIFSRSESMFKLWKCKEELSHLPIDDVIERATINSDFFELKDLTHPSLYKLFDIIVERCHPSILYHWCKNDLIQISASFRDINDVVSSVFCNRLYFAGISNFLASRTNIEYSEFINVCTYITCLLHAQVRAARKNNILYEYGG